MKRIVSYLLLWLLLIGTLTLTFSVHPAKTEPEMTATQRQAYVLRPAAAADEDGATAQATDWWTMYRHEPQHTGYSTSRAPRTNQTLWIRQFGDWVSTSPAVHDNRVFVGSDDTNVYALNTTSGLKIWNYTTRRAISSSPAVANGRVYIGSGNGKMYCLNETTGTFLWSYQTAQSISSSPCVADGKVIFGSDDYKLYCLGATAGNFLWNYPTGAGITSSPAAANGVVFFGSSDFRVYSLNLTNGGLIWSYDTRGSITASPSVVDNKVFISSFNNMYCFQASNGGIAWNRTVAGPIHSSPAIAEGSIYFGCDDRNMYCLNASNGVPKWNFTVKGYIYSSPAVAEHKVYFGSNDKSIYCLNATDGAFVWSYNTGGAVRTSSPAVANKAVFVATSYSPVWAGKLFAFGPANIAPVASNLTITPSSPVTTDNLVGSYHYHDEDGDPESGTQIRWYEDSILQPSHNDKLTIPANETSRGQTWFFTVCPSDGTDFGELQTSVEVTIHNTPPVASNLTIAPPSPVTADNLVGSYDYHDEDGDLESGTQIRWYRDGVLQSGYDDNLMIPANETSKGQAWFFTVRPRDGADFGQLQTSTEATILNTPPVIERYSPLNDPTINEGETQIFNITKSDVDLDLLTVAWYLDGTETLETSDSYAYVAGFESAGTYNITVAVSDGSGQARHEWLLTVLDVEQDIAVTGINLSKTVVGQGFIMEINVTLENQGDMTETLNVTVRANTTAIETREVTMQNRTSMLITFEWNTTYFAKGYYVISVFASPVPGESDTSDNTLEDGQVIITIPGDVNGDFAVSIFDAVTITSVYMARRGDPRYKPNLDINSNGVIDLLDVVICTSHYGQHYP